MPLDTALPPFAHDMLDALMEDAGLDILIVTSKHNVQYLLGGHRSSFFTLMDAVGTSRYLPVFVYPRGRPDAATYIAHKLESHDQENMPFWVPTATTASFGVADATEAAIQHIRAHGLPADHIGIETAFMPVQAADQLRAGFPDATFADALFPLERLRAIKTPEEITLLRAASEKVLASMSATFAQVTPGMTKAEVIDILRIEETKRGLTFEYCWLSVGPNLNRTASDQPLVAGAPISIDSGGNYRGYVGDLARMAVIGAPNETLTFLLDEIEAVQRAAFATIRPGTTGSEIHAAANARLNASTIAEHSHFVAHGMGLITHEAPRLTSHGPIKYDGYDAERPLQPGMVISVETTVADPARGAVKLEDSLLVTDAGYEFLGDGLRGWTEIAT